MEEGLEAKRKLCQEQQSELRRLLLSPDHLEDGFQLFFKQHAMLHSVEMAYRESFSLEDEVFKDLSEPIARQIPHNSENSIAWNMWHIARIEDVAMNMLVAGSPQVLTQGHWQADLGIEARDTGNAMPREKIFTLSQEINITTLRIYRVVVGRRTREIVEQLSPERLREKVHPARLEAVLDEGAVLPAAMEVIEYWSKRDIAGLLLMPATRHNLVHLNESLRLKEKKSRTTIEAPQTVFFHESDKTLKYARIEEERRFLITSIPEEISGGEDFIRIIDRYIPGTRLRLRRMESVGGEPLIYKLGQKYRPADFKPHQAIMTNLYLNEAEYRALEALGGAKLTKRRYRYQHGEYRYAMDVFEEHLSGLILAEIEGPPGVDITSLPLPAFASREVTDDPFFSGANLAVLQEDEFQAWLEEAELI